MKFIFSLLKRIYRWLKFQFRVNWIKTIYFNFRKFPFKVALKLPVYFYGYVKFTSIKGNVKINGPIRRAMVGFGQLYELNKRSKKIAEICIVGDMTINGNLQIGLDYFIYINENAHVEFGNMSSMGSNGKLICFHKIVLGEYARVGSESQIIDTNFHPMINTVTKESYPLTSPIYIGNYNFISNRVSIMSKTQTPDFCTIASNSLCNKSYLSLGENILIGGIPAKLLKQNIARDWESEREILEDLLIIKSSFLN